MGTEFREAKSRLMMSVITRSKFVNTTHLLKISGLLFLIVGTYLAVYWIDVGELLSPQWVVDALKAVGPLAPAVFILMMAAAVVISPIPSLPLDLAAGATFGVTLGTVYAVIGAEIGAVVSFLIGRVLGREALTRLLRIDISFCERCSDRHLAIFVFASRLLPIFSFDLVSYGAGLTNMSLRAFAVATLLGMIGPTFLLTYAGNQVASGEWALIVFGLAMVALLLLLPKLVVRYPTARWVQLLRGGTPVAIPPKTMETTSAIPCSSCGEPLP
ncbi:MAG: TVP38/TMEM64 family protein [Nitrospira sp. CG24C]|jgi:uncharacterized membrane protein YdjX (TVP38/TMEM64 family)|nr:MAG: TVP38/TMEM64 family protein [Nitrospira sp. CG24C]